MTSKRDYYDILGLQKSATKADIKQAYRKLALKFHPDRNKAPDAENQFKEINEAYEVLNNDQKRQTYDQFGHQAFDQASGFGGFGGANAGRQGPFTYTYTNQSGANPFNFGFGDFSDPFDIFESFFGGAGFHQGRPKPHYSLKISFMEAVSGTKKTIIHQGKSHEVKIPAGADNGTRIRFTDFDVSVDVLPHESFKRDRYDIFADHFISLTTAVLGGVEEVPSLTKPIKIKIRSGTQSHTMVRLKGQGVPYLRGQGRGDLYIRLIITVPSSLSREERHLFQQIDQIWQNQNN
jgi:DnaJ-class molecular chaperone